MCCATHNSFKYTVLLLREAVADLHSPFSLSAKNDLVGWVDLGGSYVGPTQNHILRLANELQVDTYKIFDDLKLLHFSEGKAYPYETTWAHFGLNDPLAWFDINYVMRRMDIMMEQVPAVDPWNCPHAEEWDAMTLQSFFEKESWTKYVSVLF
ncbi:hypothetical protein HPB51_029376 [Rhipicephalus microplus]|uniref:Uncharacterized protein n=1 Tax=Rhipicephalus microplus TaxID=6941 RepID=A0A9J6CV13_RHIMP|nr:hypothetical protein HPB51_029376 [Rhipicephalus microplus]